ncbi:hypothetical protein TNCV_3048101 [Trichonephila clavipes]|nr:hypothetical protein TNCV_3048101 [Trichonephila clavipes]
MVKPALSTGLKAQLDLTELAQEIGQHVGRNQATVCDADLSSLDAGRNDGDDRIHLVVPLPLNERRIARMAVMDHAATSRTKA